jgi:lipopolysaccharide/colanic/teichoic acid biosynthesis glycosyltransferase
MCFVAIAVKCTSKGAVLYVQERLGKNGKPFKIVKFRSMVDDAEKNGVRWCDKEDPRVTLLGKYLRRYHIDELPQLWNILVGDMSFIGPRPERALYYDAFETYIHGFRERLKVKPGLTGLAQVSGGSLMRPEEKIMYDIDYIKKRSLLLDFSILCNTVITVITGRYRAL